MRGGIPITGKVTLNIPMNMKTRRPNGDRMNLWMGCSWAWSMGGRGSLLPTARSTGGVAASDVARGGGI